MKSLYQAAVPLPTVHLLLAQECHSSDLFSFPPPRFLSLWSMPLATIPLPEPQKSTGERDIQLDAFWMQALRCPLSSPPVSQTRVSPAGEEKGNVRIGPRGRIMPMNEFLSFENFNYPPDSRLVEAISSAFRANSSPANFFPRLVPSFLRYLLIFAARDFFFLYVFLIDRWSERAWTKNSSSFQLFLSRLSFIYFQAWSTLKFQKK